MKMKRWKTYYNNTKRTPICYHYHPWNSRVSFGIALVRYNTHVLCLKMRFIKIVEWVLVWKRKIKFQYGGWIEKFFLLLFFRHLLFVIYNAVLLIFQRLMRWEETKNWRFLFVCTFSWRVRSGWSDYKLIAWRIVKSLFYIWNWTL